jgi:effector-binding domain-containing protein
MSKPQIEDLAAQTVAFLSLTGSFDQIPTGYDRLYGWVLQHELLPADMPQAVYLTDPATTPVDQCHFELWAPIAGEAADVEPDETGVGVKHLDPMTVAVAVHVGPYDAVAPAYEALMRWISEEGYVIVGPPMEAYMSDPEETPPERTVTQLRVPVSKA